MGCWLYNNWFWNAAVNEKLTLPYVFGEVRENAEEILIDANSVVNSVMLIALVLHECKIYLFSHNCIVWIA